MIAWKVVIERVTVIKFRMDNGGGNGAGALLAIFKLRYGRIQQSSQM